MSKTKEKENKEKKEKKGWGNSANESRRGKEKNINKEE